MIRPLLLAILLFAAVLHYAAAQDPTVRTLLGSVRGTTMTSRSGRTIYSFLGMRYAEPPVGELRFKPPVPLRTGWEGVQNASEDGPSCPQPKTVLSGPKSEDCLFINVYTTKLSEEGESPKYPVLVYIHHGGWFLFSGQSKLMNPRYLMDEDIVFVAFNYRLGALGFLSTGDSEVPGNNGLKDQLQALKWVHDNIASFGGDPNLVTIYGYSAGAASVQYHMASPRSAGLFHRAISSSGSALSSWAITRDPMSLTRRQAKLLNCPNAENATSKQIVDCLTDKEAEEIANSYFRLREWHKDPLVIFAPVIEAEGSSDAPFIAEDPYWLFRKGNFSQVPWLTGTTNNEWMRRAKQILANDTVLADLSQNFERLAPILFYYERDTPSSQRKSRKLHGFYFPEGITKDSLQEITDLYTDGAFLYGADTSVKMISSVSRSPVYYYQFVYRGRFGHMSTEPGMDRPPGAAHHDDLIYVFYPKGLFPFLEDDFPEAVISKRLVEMWANFARTGNPTPVSRNGSDGQMGVRWAPLTPSDLSYLEIGEEPVMKNSLNQERAAIWEEYIYQKPQGNTGN
ncbi:juvenile hormone esterase-like [Ischnura elegans]|uniref:juvenile hormone esterase-like n=1 Tax=Ischnura elegans TaxID=197161 RepID=UPI001ED86E34|nr:juvenile hormone esterase-like [Ischnura elegans]